MNQEVKREIRDIIHETFAIKINQKPNKIALVQTKLKISKELMEKASQRVAPFVKEYLHDKDEDIKDELKEFMQAEMEKGFEGFIRS